MSRFLYTGNKTNQISFPLGGLGTGCIGLAGNGRLIDWEIYNRPNKGSINGFSHFSIKAESGDRLLDARVLHGDLHAPYTGDLSNAQFRGFGFGPRREFLSGMPHFRDVAFRGEFPFAELSFLDEHFPGDVRMVAFNPYIPLNAHDSGIPAAMFEIQVTNSTQETITYSVAGVLGNPLPATNIHTIYQGATGTTLHLTTDGLAPTAINYGDLALMTDHGDVSWQQYWFRGAWFDSLEVYWRDFAKAGRLQNRAYAAADAGAENTGMLCGHMTLAPGQSRTIRYLISWNFPNCENYWTKRDCGCADEGCCEPAQSWKNYYATQWSDARASGSYALTNWDRLHAETQRFKTTLFASTLPEAALDAVSANLSILKSPTVMRLEDGTFYGWEGCHPTAGCCEGSCTHVWNYAQALPFLFPELERSMREVNFTYNQRPDGGLSFRLQLPLGSPRSKFRPCADGQFGDVMKVYREWKISGDSEWLRSMWPAIVKAIAFAWHPDNDDRWDPDKTGVLWGRQHHTLDMELFGPNAWLTGFYLGALKAAAEMADHLGETAAASEYRDLFARGKRWADEHLFNGEYYHQLVDLNDRELIAGYESGRTTDFGSALEAYWNDEHGEIKYQIGEGCEIDQVLAQWHANLYGIGELFDPAQVKRALASLFRYNFKDSMRDQYNPCRIYCLNDEAGLIIADWPEGKYKPMIPLPYSQETQNGYEYAAAIQMIQSGLVDEGMAAVTAIRDRYDGERRNPWNEFECGSNYARSMASYSLLNTFAGFRFDMVDGLLGFDPLQLEDGRFRCFWSLGTGWGEIDIAPDAVRLRVIYGELSLTRVALPFIPSQGIDAVQIGSTPVTWEKEGDQVRFAETVTLEPETELVVHLRTDRR